MNIEKLKRELKRYDDLLDKLTIENAGETYGSDEWASAMVQIISNIKDIKKKLEQLKHDKYQEPDRVSKSEITPSTKITMHKEKHDFDPETNMCLNCGFNKTVEAEKYIKMDTSESPLPIAEPRPTVTPPPTSEPTEIPIHKEKHEFDPKTNICLSCGVHKTVEAEKHTLNPEFFHCFDCDHQFPISEDLNLPLENETKEQKSRRL